MVTHRATGSSQEFVQKCYTFQDLVGIWIIGFWGEGKTRVPQEKPQWWGRIESQQQTQPMTLGTGIEPWGACY